MAGFLNKLGDMAKTVADKTGDMIEVGKRNTKIASEQASITALKQKIGGFYYERFGAGDEYPAEVTELCRQIEACEETIANLQAEITEIKGNLPSETMGKCPVCGASNSSGTKFCGSCGQKLL